MTPSLRMRLTRAVPFVAGLAILVAVLPPASMAAPSRIRATLDRAAQSQPQFVPRAPDGAGEFTAMPQLKPVHFAFDRAAIQPSETAVIDADAAWLRANSDYAILVAGFADERGTPGYNLALGERRAMALRDQLVTRGVRADRITLVSYGEGLPSCRTHGEPCWSANRAAMILVRRAELQTP